MTVNVGVIGVGMIGQDHIRRLTTVISGSAVVAVTDVNADQAAQVAAPVGAKVFATGQELINDPSVDAVIVCSWGPTHEEYVLAAIAADKPVFCEKPLATTQEACLRIIAAETELGHRVVQVGYMRRYDHAYRALKAVIDSGDIGAPTMMHGAHRNPSVPGHYTREMAITDTAVHDIDVARWLLGEEIIAAETDLGHRVVQVGYMRRFDPAYRAMKAVIDSGDIGAPTMMHGAHRNPAVPGHYTREMAITDTAVHDIDLARWLLGEEIVAAQVLKPRRNSLGGDLEDPLLLVFETESGVLVDIETNVNIRYGYDIRGEVVGEEGTVSLAESTPILTRRSGSLTGRVPEDWRERFIRAYDIEFQEWIDAIDGRGRFGPSSWDGYAAAAVSDAAVRALHDGTRVAVELIGKPDLYT